MHIHTNDIQSMEASICEALNIDLTELNHVLEECYAAIEKDHKIIILDHQYEFFQSYVNNHLMTKIDDIAFYHLSRRLKGSNDDHGYNLIDLLTKPTALSDFLHTYGLSFQYEGHIKLFLHEKEVDLKQDYDYAYQYLRDRFGYTYQDFSMKGFAFCDCLAENDVYASASSGPQLLNYFYVFMEDEQLLEDYEQQSTFTLLEYLIPIENVCFEDYEDLTVQEKQEHMVVKTLQHLYNHKYSSLTGDWENPILSMVDDQTIDKAYLHQVIPLE